MTQVDLHVHSTRSDGTYTPSQLVDYAMEKGLSAFALTDHDTIDGIDEALAAAKGKPITVIPGIEYSTRYQERDIHIVGLFIDHHSPAFLDYLARFKQSRTDRNHKLCQNLQQAGLDITYEALLEMFPNCVLTRAHYAKFLLEKGFVKSRNEAFDRYLGDHTPYFIPRENITPQEVIDVTRRAGGVPILAHATLYQLGKEQLELLISTLKDAGLMGIECLYCSYTAADERHMKEYAKKYHLLPSGGSDFHGATKPGLDLGCGYGSLYVPDDYLIALQKAATSSTENTQQPNPITSRDTVNTNYDLLFTDLDGTLLREDKTISEALRTALLSFLEAGHKLVLASGRPLYSILERKNALALPDDNVYISAYNGSLLYDCKQQKVLAEYPVSLPVAQQLFDLATNKGLHIHTYNDEDTVISNSHDAALDYYIQFVPSDIIISSSLTTMMHTEPFKLLAIDLDEPNTNRLHAFQQDIIASSLHEQISTAFSHDTYLEFYHPKAGKGNGLRNLCELLGLSSAQAVAAGDAQNDLSMLEAAGLGVAMKNASLQLREHADFVTASDNDHDGLVEVLERFFV